MRIAVIGAGMAGASFAFEACAKARVTLLEAETHPGFHTTGRSAALYAKSYGNAVIRALTVASEALFTEPPVRFCDHPLLNRRGAMFIARADQLGALESLRADIASAVPAARIVDGQEALRTVPILRGAHVEAALIEHDSRDMDVNAILQGYLHGARARGATLLTDARVSQLEHGARGWSIQAGRHRIEADIVVNAAGAWADGIAGLAGLAPLGITPNRRTACLVEPPEGQTIGAWPAIIDVAETFYVKPDAGMLLCSPADETPMEPCDCQPDELDIAIAIDRIQKAMDLPVRHIARSWAGLRSFARDKTPVLGPDPRQPAFFWLAGQGGYGIQTAPAMAQLAAAATTGLKHNLAIDSVPTLKALSPARLIPDP